MDKVQPIASITAVVDGDRPGTATGGIALPPAGRELPPKPAQVALEAVAVHIDEFLADNGRELRFQVDRTTGATIVSVRDRATGELIRQIPSEEALRVARALHLQLPGLLVTEA